MMINLPFKTGMIYRSETHPQFDLIIDYVSYSFNDNNKIDKDYTFICWCNINKEKFTEFTDSKLSANRKSKTTFPYVYFGECSIKSMKQRIKKYNLKFIGFSNDSVVVYNNNDFEYSSGFKNMHSELYRKT